MQKRSIYIAGIAAGAVILLGALLLGLQKSVGSQALPNVDPSTKVYVTASIAELEGSETPSQFASLAINLDNTAAAGSPVIQNLLSSAEDASKNSRLLHVADRAYKATITKASLDALLSSLPNSDKVYTYSERTTDFDTGKEVLANKAIIRLTYNSTNYVIQATYISPVPSFVPNAP